MSGRDAKGASTYQKGEAAELRTFADKPTYKELSFINHAGDKDPHKHGQNPYADSTNTYDPAAQVVIDAAKQAQSKQ
jgi:hypothetical protein